MLSSADTQPYLQQLGLFLSQLKNELDTHSLAQIESADNPEKLDKYILELNTFYYRSFHERYFPQYEKLLTDDMRRIHHLSAEVKDLNQDTLVNLKNNACLFNRAKSITIQIESQIAEIQPLHKTLARGSDESKVELLYILKELSDYYSSFLGMLRNLQAVLDDKQLITGLKQFPAHVVVGNLIMAWEPDNSKTTRDFNRLLAAWQLALQQLQKLSASGLDRDTGKVLSREFEKADAAWDDRKAPTMVRTWYKEYIQKTFNFYLHSLDFYAEKNDRKRLSQTSLQLENWLGSLLYILEQSLAYKSRGWGNLLSNMLQLTSIDAAYLHKQITYSAESMQTLEKQIKSLAGSASSRFEFHSQSSSAMLLDFLHYWQKQRNEVKAPIIMILPAIEGMIERLNLSLSRLEFLIANEESSHRLVSQNLLFLDSIQSHLQWLQNLQSDLQQILCKRCQNTYSEIDIKIEHISILPGAPFPRDYSDLLETGMVAMQESDVPEGSVLYAEGDIFLIQVGQLQDQVIPKIVISKKR